jgi:hypothetical protein
MVMESEGSRALIRLTIEGKSVSMETGRMFIRKFLRDTEIELLDITSSLLEANPGKYPPVILFF